MSATTAHALPTLPPGLLAGAERFLLATRLTLAMLATGLLVLALLWQWAFPTDQALATLIGGTAAILVAMPVLAAAWHSLRHPSLHGITDRLIALALVGAWAAGDLMTAAVLPHRHDRRPCAGGTQPARLARGDPCPLPA